MTAICLELKLPWTFQLKTANSPQMITDNVELIPACFAAVSAAEIVPNLPKNCYSVQAVT